MKSRALGVWAALLTVVLLAGSSLAQPVANPVPVKVDMGAAEKLPADVSYYASSFRTAPRVMKVWNSNAMQNILQLPMMQQFLGQAMASPEWKELLQVFETHPLAVEGLPILKDMVTQEMFFCAGPGVPTFIEAMEDTCGEAYRSVLLEKVGQLLPAAGKNASAVSGVVDMVLSRQEQLRVPSVLMGFRLKKPKRAQAFLMDFLPAQEELPLGLAKKVQIEGASFHVYQIRGADLPKEMIEQMNRDLHEQKIESKRRLAMMKYVEGYQVTFAVGVRDGYLLFLLGEDLSFLKRWGKGESLAASKPLASLRRRNKAGLTGLRYCSRPMAAISSMTRSDAQRLVDGVFELLPTSEMPKGLAAKLRADAKTFVSELTFRKPTASLSYSFETSKGIESFSYSDPAASKLDCSLPLSLLKRRTSKTIVAAATRPKKGLAQEYAWSVKWLNVAYGYVEEFGVPQLDAEQRKEYQKLMAVIQPFFTSLHAATRDHLIPSIDGAPALMVFDGSGQLKALPESLGVKLPKPIPIPRLGYLVVLNDAKKFRTAIAQYNKAIAAVIADAKKTYSEIPRELAWPEHKTVALAGGELFYFPVPGKLGDDVFPCAILKGNELVLATSKSLATQMVTPPVRSSRTMVRGGAATVVNFQPAHVFMRGLTDSVFEALKANGVIHPDDLAGALIAKDHLDTVLHSLKAFQTYYRVTTTEEGLLLEYTLLRVKDVKAAK